jgi:hypothetical protein
MDGAADTMAAGSTGMTVMDVDSAATDLRDAVLARAFTAAEVDSVVADPMAEVVASMAEDRTVVADSTGAADMVADAGKTR